MKEILVLSGKGGTGKTTVASGLIKLSQVKAYADCDVDAPNLHLLMEADDKPSSQDYYGLDKAEIDSDLCTSCDICRQYCRFNAIFVDDSYQVDPYACEGCAVCQLVCPEDAISMLPHIDGQTILYENEDRIFSTGQLKIGSGTSGLLVSQVKKRMREGAKDIDLAIIDGSPGIGCPVIASISGVDLVLIVAEPSLSGISDMERIVETSRKFRVPIALCINKYDTNKELSLKIEEYCQREKIDFLGKIAFDSDAVKAVNMGNTIVDIDCQAGRDLREIHQKLMEKLEVAYDN